MRIPFQLSILASAVVLAGCGGGGGGPGGSNLIPVTGSKGYTTPQKVGTIDPTVENDTSYLEFNSFTADITGDGATDVIFAGRETATRDVSTHSNSKIHMFAWENGTLVNRTSQWFDSGENEILGTEPSVKFTDFWKTGRTDMFVAHGTDMRYYGPSYVYRNTGSKFERIEIPMNNVWSHGSDVGDINGDTYPDIAIIDYGPNTTLAINNTVDNFDTYVDSRGIGGDLRWGGSSIVMGDFNNDGSTEFIVTDNGCQTALGCDDTKTTRMYGYTIDGSNNLSFNYLNDLPLPLLDHDGIDSHDVRVVSHDFDEDGIQDVIVFSRDADWYNKRSEIQFLKNDGSGNFSDVTADVLVGYDTGTHSTYRPVFVDLNNDGKTDILVSGGDYSGTNDSHQFLLKSSDNKYVAAYQNILTDFITDVGSDGNTVNVFKAPNGKTYLVSWAHRQVNSNDRVLDVYLSELTDTTDVTTAQSAVDLLQSTWSYLSADQAAEALNSGAIPYAGGYLLNMDQAMQPLGDLSVNSVTLSGSLSAPGISTNTFNSVIATDAIGRGYNVDLSVRSSSVANINSFSKFYTPLSSMTSNMVANNDNTFYAVGDQNNYTTGYTSKNNSWNYTFSHTVMDRYSPWLHLSGVFGEVESSSTSELALHRAYNSGSWLQLGYTNSTTDIKPGLVTKADPIEALYGVFGHKFDGALKGFEVMTGIEPKIIAGAIGVKLPEKVDHQGNVMYTYRDLQLKNMVSKFARVNYTKEFKYGGKIQLRGALSESGANNATISYEMPL